MIRVLEVTSQLYTKGGIESLLMDIARIIDRNQIQIEFLRTIQRDRGCFVNRPASREQTPDSRTEHCHEKTHHDSYSQIRKQRKI